MAPGQGYSEGALIEQPVVAEFAALGRQTADCFDESPPLLTGQISTSSVCSEPPFTTP